MRKYKPQNRIEQKRQIPPNFYFSIRLRTLLSLLWFKKVTETKLLCVLLLIISSPTVKNKQIGRREINMERRNRRREEYRNIGFGIRNVTRNKKGKYRTRSQLRVLRYELKERRETSWGLGIQIDTDPSRCFHFKLKESSSFLFLLF